MMYARARRAVEPRGANQTVAEHTGISHRLMKRRPTLPYYFQIRKVKVGHRPGFPESNGRCKVRGGSFTAVLCRLVSLGFTRRGRGGGAGYDACSSLRSQGGEVESRSRTVCCLDLVSLPRVNWMDVDAVFQNEMTGTN